MKSAPVKDKANGASAASHVSSWKSIYVDVYACVQCGYFEEYLVFNDPAIEKLKVNWEKY